MRGTAWVLVGLLLALTSTLGSAFVFLDVIPSRLEGKTRGETIHVVEIKAGTPRTTLRLALDYEGSGVITPQPYTEEISSTYSPSGGGSDEVIIAGKRLRLPFSADLLRVEELACDTCEGLLGVGPSSPLWVVWKKATFGSGAISLDGLAHEVRDAERFNRMEIREQKRNSIDCDVGYSGLCRTEALVGPDKELNTVIFSFETSRTLVPPTVYDAYTAGLNIFDNDLDEWPDLEFEFTVLTNDSKGPSVKARIRRHDIVSDTRLGTPELLIAPQTGFPNTTIIGRPAWRSFFVYKDWITNEAQIFNWKVEKEFTYYGRFILSVSGLVLMWWKGTETGEWAIKWKFRPIRVIAAGVVSVFAIVTIWVDSTRCALLGFVLMDAYLQSFTYLLVILLACAIFVHLLMWQGYSMKSRWIYEGIVGLTHTEEEAVILERKDYDKRTPPLSPSTARRTHPALTMPSVYQTRAMPTSLGSQARVAPTSLGPQARVPTGRVGSQANHAIPTGYQARRIAQHVRRDYPAGARLANTNPFHMRPSGGPERLIETFSNPFQSTIHPSPPIYHDGAFHSMIGSQRLWSIISFSFETLVLFTTFMIWITVREDTLSGFGALMLFSYILINSTYHLLVQMYHRSGWHNALWYFFMAIQLAFVLLTYAVAIYFVFYPFSLRFVPDYGNTPIVITALFSVVLFYFAEYLADTRVPTLYFV